MVMNFRFLYLVLFVSFSLKSVAQINSTAIFSEATEYSANDRIFVFCTNNADGGSLYAQDSTGIGSYDFKWYKFNSITKDYSDALTGNTFNIDSTRSDLSNLTTGGYKVVLTKAGFKQEYVGWVFNNTNRTVEISFDSESDCNFIWMQTNPDYPKGVLFNTDLTYYDTISDQSYVFKNSVQYAWSASPDEDDFRSLNAPYASIVDEGPYDINGDNESELPTENTTFTVVVTDRFGCTVQDDIEYVAIETDTDFSWTIFDYKTDAIIKIGDRETGLSGTAPLKVRFTNNSKNAKDFIIFFGDTLLNDDIDTIYTSDEFYEPEHTYYYTVADSGKIYVARLYSISEHGCKDSLFLNIKVEPSKIEFPNVFTPNDDEFNNVFITTDFKSIRSFKITIFNRAGQTVHEYEGDVRDWDGWDGLVKNGSKAPEGNYFFVVEVLGWDNVTYNNKNLKGTNSSSESGTEGDATAKTQVGVIRLFR